jgi:uncharacterized lipoprotein YbaY
MPGENMSKAKAETATAAAAPETAAETPQAPAPKTSTFRDTVYTSRTLILPDGTSLAVAKGRVTVEDSNTQALEYLKAHNELKALE